MSTCVHLRPVLRSSGPSLGVLATSSQREAGVCPSARGTHFIRDTDWWPPVDIWAPHAVAASPTARYGAWQTDSTGQRGLERGQFITLEIRRKSATTVFPAARPDIIIPMSLVRATHAGSHVRSRRRVSYHTTSNAAIRQAKTWPAIWQVESIHLWIGQKPLETPSECGSVTPDGVLRSSLIR